MTAAVAAVPGPVRFARYAFPPNELGYCGPDDHRALLEYAAAGVSDGGLVDLARGFDGAWPYLTLIAGAAGLDDPLDPQVVEAYWVGNDLLGRVDVPDLGRHLDERFRARAGRAWGGLSASIAHGVPHHSYHVFCVYPWVGLLRSGATEHALRVLDRCRIRAAIVRSVDGATAVVEDRPLVWDGRELGLGAVRTEVAVLAEDGHRLAEAVAVGDVVTLHWDWVCERIDPTRARTLARVTAGHVALANEQLATSPRTAEALGG